MKNIVSIALLAVGIILLCMAWGSYHSASSGLSRTFTGSSSNKTIFLLVGGVVGAALGAGGLLVGGRKV